MLAMLLITWHARTLCDGPGVFKENLQAMVTADASQCRLLCGTSRRVVRPAAPGTALSRLASSRHAVLPPS